ncbi:hypothetical protein CHUAL_010523 [Chamberlinius hualienensis]
MWKLMLIWMFWILVCSSLGVNETEWFNKKFHHVPSHVTPEDLTLISGLSNQVLFNSTLSKIAVPRVLGTKGHEDVKSFIINSMRSLNWDVELDIFSQDTVIGHHQFTNIIATLDPDAQRHLVLACHYDSKMDPKKTLILATDSAVPCSMMINLVQLLDPFLLNNRSMANDVTLQLIFFDGEEAFLDWTETDSIYGARHLAHKMSTTSFDPLNSNHSTNHLHRMDVMVLLDLLGYREPTFVNFFHETSHLFSKMKDIERLLNEEGLIQTGLRPYFTNFPSWEGVEDDHIPFLLRGVHVLHLIPVPFPPVWHKETDIVDNLDFESIDNLNKILRVFVVSYLHLNSTITNP